jgi:membrane-associated phospholipid phosphatase
VWPSIHVFNTAAISVSVLRSRFFKNANLTRRAFIVVWAALIILSTVFIKQHSLLDVLAGGILAVVATLIVWDLDYVARFRRWDAFVARRLAARAKKRTVL